MTEILALDFGGSAVKYALISRSGEILQKGKSSAPYEGLDAFIDLIKSFYEKYKKSICGIAISMPGKIDPIKKIAHTGGAYHFIKDLPLGDILKEFIPIPLTMCNDAKCAAYAELRLGSLKGVSTGVVIVLGTGIGGSLIVNNQILQGLNFTSGEFSSILTNGQDYEDINSCWAVQNGITGLLSVVQEELNTDENFTGEEIFQMANASNKAVIRAIERFCIKLAIQVYNLQVILDPEKIVIGGGISVQPLLFELINKHLDCLEKIGKIHNLPIKRPKVEACKFLNDANLLGAFILLKEKLTNE